MAKRRKRRGGGKKRARYSVKATGHGKAWKAKVCSKGSCGHGTGKSLGQAVARAKKKLK